MDNTDVDKHLTLGTVSASLCTLANAISLLTDAIRKWQTMARHMLHVCDCAMFDTYGQASDTA